MAKQVELAQLAQMTKDLTVTAHSSYSAPIRAAATAMLPTVAKLVGQLAAYQQLTR